MIDLDVDGFADRLGAGLERLAKGDWSMFVDMPSDPAPIDQETAAQLGKMLTTVVHLSSLAACMEGAALGIAQACGMSPDAIQLFAEKGRRSGRRNARKLIDKLMAGVHEDESDD
jgi:hypothetical protein